MNTIANTKLTLSKPDSSNLEILLNVTCEPNEVIGWIDQYCEYIQRLLQEKGAIMIRRLDIQGSKKLAIILEKLFGQPLLEYTYRSTPRTKMRGRIYTSTEYPAAEVIPQHNENAYANRWPMRIGFYCVKASSEGGATPIANSLDIYQDIPDDIKQTFEQNKLRYVRNYNNVDLPWTEVFQTTNKDEVEAYCQANNIEFTWLKDGFLRTEQVNPAVISHPYNHQKLWFNQAHLFHISSQSEPVAKSLINEFGVDGLPRNVYFGDGSEIPSDMIAAISKVYEKHKVTIPWQEGDLLLLDNMMYSHGRGSYSGSRKILTATSIAMSAEDMAH